jgi:predicted RNase H-like HicB family nuclease
LAPGEQMWSIVFPEFPGVTSAATRCAEVPQQAQDALATAIRSEFHDPRYIVVAVEVPDSTVRINIGIDRSLLKQIDDAASRRGVSRSGFLSEAARKLLRAASE